MVGPTEVVTPDIPDTPDVPDTEPDVPDDIPDDPLAGGEGTLWP